MIIIYNNNNPLFPIGTNCKTSIFYPEKNAPGGRASPGRAGNTAPAPAVFPATMAYTLQLLEEEAGNGRSMCMVRECHLGKL